MRADAAMRADTEGYMNIDLAVEVDCLGIAEYRGIAIGDGIGQHHPVVRPKPDAPKFAVMGDAAKEVRHGVDAHEFLYSAKKGIGIVQALAEITARVRRARKVAPDIRHGVCHGVEPGHE